MAYLHCPRCRRTAWVRSSADRAVDCRVCGTRLDKAAGGRDAHLLAAAVRERLARDARTDALRARFVRDPG